MGGRVSSTLEVDEASLETRSALRGTLVLHNSGKRLVPLQRAARVSLQFRNTLTTGEGATTIENVHIVWQVGGDDLVKAGTVLQPGANRFEFDYSLKSDPQQPAAIESLDPPEVWLQRYGTFRKMKYDYILRAGSPPQTNDVVLHPKLLPPGDSGRRVGIGPAGAWNHLVLIPPPELMLAAPLAVLEVVGAALSG